MDKNFAREVALEVVKLQASLLTSTGVALLCGYDEDSSGLRKILRDASFPRPIQLVEGGRKRWVRDEVEAWLKERVRQYRAANEPVFNIGKGELMGE